MDLSERFTFNEPGAQAIVGSNEVVHEQTLEMSSMEDNSTGRSVSSTPLQASPHEYRSGSDEAQNIHTEGDIPTITVSGAVDDEQASEGSSGDIGPPSAAGTSTDQSQVLGKMDVKQGLKRKRENGRERRPPYRFEESEDIPPPKRLKIMAPEGSSGDIGPPSAAGASTDQSQVLGQIRIRTDLMESEDGKVSDSLPNSNANDERTNGVSPSPGNLARLVPNLYTAMCRKPERKPAKKMPDNANEMNPIKLLYRMRPQTSYQGVGKVGEPPNVRFTTNCNIDGQSFTGSGTTKNSAKRHAAILACQAVLGVVYTKKVLDTIGTES